MQSEFFQEPLKGSVISLPNMIGGSDQYQHAIGDTDQRQHATATHLYPESPGSPALPALQVSHPS